MTTTSVEAEVEAMQEIPALRVADRCDNAECGSQAFVLTMHAGFPLLWCQHHFASRINDLAEHVVIDDREKLLVRV